MHLTVPDDLSAPELVAALARGLTTAEAGTTRIRRRYFDSFDWRLHRAGLSLVREEGHWRLQRLADGGMEAEAPATAGPWPRFATDFPDPDLKGKLARHLKMRAAVHLVTAIGEERTWRVVNASGKTVLNVVFSELRCEKPASAGILRMVTLLPRRGHRRRTERALAAAACDLEPLVDPPLDALLQAAGLEPESYTSRFSADLAPEQTSLAAATTVCHALLRTMRRNEAGLKADIDTEFLHDFRVSVRRLRSALTIFKDVFDPNAVRDFKHEFAALGRLTGPLRDLDVHLLDEPRFRAMLPDSLQPGLDGFFARLADERVRALHLVRSTLGSPAYRGLVAAWRVFLAAPIGGRDADLPVSDLARHRLRRRRQRVLHRGGAIVADSPDTALHRLRIECKKLRYLLEFFATLFPARDVERLVRHLKGLQDNLGEFNDLTVQQEVLAASLADLPARRRGSLVEAAALGGLATALAARQREVRDEYSAAFADFTRPAVDKRFTRLLSRSGGKRP